jgi:hypothetical protein
MGNDIEMRVSNRLLSVKYMLYKTVVLSILVLCVFAGCHSSKGNAGMEKYQAEIGNFRKGQEFNGDIDIWLKDGKPDPDGLKILTGVLQKDSGFVQEQAAKALIQIGIKTDELFSQGGNLLRNPVIIKILLTNGISSPGSIRDKILDVCINSIPVELLKPYVSILLDNLIQFKDSEILLVIAKSKPEKAKDALEKMLLSPQLSEEDEMKVAVAALGNEKVENYLINQFITAKDADQKIRFAKLLGYVGTKKAATALAGEMRTDMIKILPNVYARSVRLDIAHALEMINPETTILYENNIDDDDSYEKIEHFCQERYGIVWSKNRPPFLAMQGFPSQPGGE